MPKLRSLTVCSFVGLFLRVLHVKGSQTHLMVMMNLASSVVYPPEAIATRCISPSVLALLQPGGNYVEEMATPSIRTDI